MEKKKIKKEEKKEEVHKSPELCWVCVMDCGKFKRGMAVSDVVARADSSFNLHYFVRSKICL